ncbi:MAG: MBL fold metallo-hydrolase [Lachnospiraceae bacterium]|nr:MBL fold metallo-hydrolase [Lachnospiraceae bacterium]
MAEIIRINDSTWRFEDDSVRFFLLCGDEKAALVDSGMNTPDARKMAESLTDLPIILINTHADPDHISGNAAFEEFYMSPAEEPNYRENNGKGTILPVKEGDIIDLGNRTLSIIDIPGHTPGSIAILDEKYRVLISGDSVEDGNVFMFGKYRNMDLYIDSLRHLARYDGRYDEIYAMHGSIPVKPDIIGKLIEGAGQIKNGEAAGTKLNLFGSEVLLYKFPYAGFLCETEG